MAEATGTVDEKTEDVTPKATSSINSTDRDASLVSEPSSDGPSLKSFASLLEEVEAEDKVTESLESVLTQEALDKAVLEYIEQIELKSVKVWFSNAKFEIEGEKIVSTVGSSAAKGTIQKEHDFLPFLRNKLSTNKLLLVVNVDLSMQEVEKPKQQAPRIFSNKDKYIALKEINIEVDELRKRLDLGFDNK